jgi:hypothetical protein
MAHSLLMVPVPELDAVVRRRLEVREPEHLPLEDHDTAAHVTLLGPFGSREEITDGVLAELRRYFADVTPFDYQLTRVSRFPGGTVYLTPEPAAPFRQLTLGLTRRFPERPPYAGAFDDVVPHLSIPLLPDEELTDVEAELAGRLPVAARAQEAALYWWEDGACGTLESFRFGTSAA